MTRRCGECSAEVEFEVPAGTFRAVWQRRRARKKPDGALQPAKRYIYDSQGQPITQQIREAEEKIVELLMMDHLVRTIIHLLLPPTLRTPPMHGGMLQSTTTSPPSHNSSLYTPHRVGIDLVHWRNDWLQLHRTILPTNLWLHLAPPCRNGSCQPLVDKNKGNKRWPIRHLSATQYDNHQEHLPNWPDRCRCHQTSRSKHDSNEVTELLMKLILVVLRCLILMNVHFCRCLRDTYRDQCV